MIEGLDHYRSYLAVGGELTQIVDRLILGALSKMEDALEA